MRIKGTTFKGREAFLREELGDAAWDAFVKEAAKKFAFLRDPVLPITLLPPNDFLRFNDMLIDRFYNGNKQTYFLFGQKSAEWALTVGPYKALFGTGDLTQFLMTMPRIWSVYFDDGTLKVKILNDTTCEIEVTGVDVHHVYFEYLVIGYVMGGLHLAGAKHVDKKIVHGFSKGDDEVLYRLTVSSDSPARFKVPEGSSPSP